MPKYRAYSPRHLPLRPDLLRRSHHRHRCLQAHYRAGLQMSLHVLHVAPVCEGALTPQDGCAARPPGRLRRQHGRCCHHQRREGWAALSPGRQADLWGHRVEEMGWGRNGQVEVEGGWCGAGLWRARRWDLDRKRGVPCQQVPLGSAGWLWGCLAGWYGARLVAVEVLEGEGVAEAGGRSAGDTRRGAERWGGILRGQQGQAEGSGLLAVGGRERRDLQALHRVPRWLRSRLRLARRPAWVGPVGAVPAVPGVGAGGQGSLVAVRQVHRWLRSRRRQCLGTVEAEPVMPGVGAGGQGSLVALGAPQGLPQRQSPAVEWVVGGGAWWCCCRSRSRCLWQLQDRMAGPAAMLSVAMWWIRQSLRSSHLHACAAEKLEDGHDRGHCNPGMQGDRHWQSSGAR